MNSAVAWWGCLGIPRASHGRGLTLHYIFSIIGQVPAADQAPACCAGCAAVGTARDGQDPAGTGCGPPYGLYLHPCLWLRARPKVHWRRLPHGSRTFCHGQVNDPLFSPLFMLKSLKSQLIYASAALLHETWPIDTPPPPPPHHCLSLSGDGWLILLQNTVRSC